MNDNDINDIRNSKDFKGISFSKFKKSDVEKELLNCIVNNKIESACNWCAELICAGHYQDIWEIILQSVSKYIHLGNPKLPIYINLRFNKFKEIIINGYIGNELLLRNNNNIKILFAEIICVLCLSNKKPAFEPIKIKNDEEFSLTYMSNKFKANSVDYGYIIWKNNDPKEIYVAINELAYLLDKKENLLQCCYWVEWIIEFEKKCRKKKEPIYCERRTFAPVDSKFQLDVIWIIWELIIIKADNNDIKMKCIESLLELFSLKYSWSIKKKRRYILYFALELIMENTNFNIEIISEKSKQTITQVCKNIDNVYKKIKKNEIAPKTNYLFKDVTTSKSNLQNTIEKLDIMKNIDEYIINN
jgi:hypothetical protein|tara:strand:+ start:9157 stop:10233 length:1077 start_codon:yes stop_codon:yes gene_type:complete